MITIKMKIIIIIIIILVIIIRTSINNTNNTNHNHNNTKYKRMLGEAASLGDSLALQELVLGPLGFRPLRDEGLGFMGFRV